VTTAPAPIGLVDGLRSGRPAISIVEAMESADLFGPWFKNRKHWGAWFAFLKALFALPMDAAEAEIYQRCTERTELPTEQAREAWLIIGRRGGKSRILATIAVFLACFIDWSPYLAPGERATIPVIAADRKQARVILGYIRALIANVPALQVLTGRDISETIDLANGVTIEIVTCSYKTSRGRTIVVALCDEAAFWADEAGANPASEIIAALRPGMATIPGGLLLCASSPYARKGPLYSAYTKHFAKPGRVLVWKAATRIMNPTVPQAWIDEQYEADPASAAAEYGAEFRNDIESFVSREVVDAAVIPGRHELPPVPGTRYVAFTDPSGGAADSFTIGIAHMDKATNRAVLDAVRERRPPFSPEAVVQEYAELLKSYGLQSVDGDRYAGQWPRERFRLAGIRYDLSDKPASDLYRDLLPLLNSGRTELLELPRLSAQLCSLERRTSRGGRDLISHPVGGHDDLAVAAAGALLKAASGGKGIGHISNAAVARMRMSRPFGLQDFRHPGSQRPY